MNRPRARALWLVAGLVACRATSAQTVQPAPAAFVFAHAGEVDSGVLSILGTFSSTHVTTAPTIRFPMFDPAVGRLTGTAVSVNTSTSTFTVAPSGVFSLVAFASASRSLAYTVSAGSTSATDGATRFDSGGVLLTLLGLGSAEIGGAQLARTISFTSPADLANLVGAGTVAVDLSATDTLGVSTLLSLLNGAGFTGSGQASGSVSLTYAYAPYPGGSQLSIAEVASAATANRGDSITYTVVFTNNGVSPIDALAISEATPAYTNYQSSRTLVTPAGMTVSGASAPAVGTTGPLRWTFSGRLAPAASGTLQYTVQVN